METQSSSFNVNATAGIPPILNSHFQEDPTEVNMSQA